jgi:S-adenosylmethionine synthetase
VAAGLADRLEIQVAYAIGKARPVGLYADSFGTGRLGSDQRIAEVLQQVFDLRPEAILERLDLRRPIYQRTAAYGHFGRDEPGFTWEALDRVDEVRAAAGL